MVTVVHPRVIRAADLPQRVRHGGVPRHSQYTLEVRDREGTYHHGQFLGAKASNGDYRLVEVSLRLRSGIIALITVRANSTAYLFPEFDNSGE